MNLSFDEQQMMGIVVDRLVGRYPQVSESAVAEVVTAAYASFADSSVRDFVPMLVEKHAAAELDAHVATVADPGSATD